MDLPGASGRASRRADIRPSKTKKPRRRGLNALLSGISGSLLGGMTTKSHDLLEHMFDTKNSTGSSEYSPQHLSAGRTLVEVDEADYKFHTERVCNSVQRRQGG